MRTRHLRLIVSLFALSLLLAGLAPRLLDNAPVAAASAGLDAGIDAVESTHAVRRQRRARHGMAVPFFSFGARS